MNQFKHELELDNYLNLCSQAESQSQAGDGESSSQPKPIDYDALMIEAVGGRNAKGMIYGLSLDGRMRAKALTSKSQYANYSDIVRGMGAEVEAKLKQKITEQQQTIDNISATIARQNKMIAFFARHANIDLDAMDLDEDTPHDVPGSDASNNNQSDE